jgi:hypothetical protein
MHQHASVFDVSYTPFANCLSNTSSRCSPVSVAKNGPVVYTCRTKRGSTLHNACRNGIVRMWLQYGGNVNDDCYFDKATALHLHACVGGWVEVIRLLLHNGADISATNHDGCADDVIKRKPCSPISFGEGSTDLVVLLILGVLGDGPFFWQSSGNPCEPYVWPLEQSPSLSEEWSR